MILKPTKQKPFTKSIYGYDIETYKRNKKFYCATLYSQKFEKTWGGKYKVFYNKRDVINELKTNKFQCSVVAATNLGFDFNGTFFNEDEAIEIDTLFRGSSLISAFTFLENSEFTKHPKKKARKKLEFVDTLNYALLSVEQLGKILNLPKLKKPISLGRLPDSKSEREELITYNIRDAEISLKGLEFLYASFYKLGATPKMTIASTALSLFKNKYLNDVYFIHKENELLDIFNSYYGGRTEVFKRGTIKNYNYYDFNSLYPAVMLNEFPDPNSLRRNSFNDYRYIEGYEGVSKVDIEAPETYIPLLPYRTQNKLLFPIGSLTGWYTHIELRKAKELGYVIKKVYRTYYYKEMCEPFKDYVNDLYNLRLEFKKENNPMEYVTKILMNSLYGKFGQKFIDRDNWLPFNHTIEELAQFDSVERFGNYIRVKKLNDKPKSFCFPIWSSYITAFARIKLFDVLNICSPVYCDTDSIITKKEFIDSNKLGKLKLEHFIKEGIIVKPKFYAFKSHKGNYIRLKGCGKPLNFKEFNEILSIGKVSYNKYVKFKEAMRRHLIPNEIIPMEKRFSLEDEKREWDQMFEPSELNDSKPLIVDRFNVPQVQQPESYSELLSPQQ